MGELQATVEFSVELYKFYNVDLFQRGFYQIRTALKVLPKLPVKIEVSLPHNPGTDLVFPACVVNGTAVSKTFQVLYRNEEVTLEDVALFKAHIIVDSHKIEETIERADFQLVVELWFTEQSFGPDQHSSIQCVSTRTLNLHFLCAKGLHHHLPILFDYFHLSAVTMTIHASLVAVHQPYINTTKPGKPGWLLNSPRMGTKLHSSSIENVLFGSSASSKGSISNVRLSHARQVHREICSVLLSAYETLQSKLQDYMKLLPPWQQLRIESADCYSRLHNLSDFAKNVDSEDDLIAIANSDIAQLCAENIILWQQFLEVFTMKDRIRQHLARDHHLQRVKRFAEGFFVVEHPRHALLSCSDASYHSYQTISETTRKSRYFTMLPPVSVECIDMDGSVDMLPIIFEDQYQESTRRASRNSRCSDPGINIHDISVNVKDRCNSGDELTARALLTTSLLTVAGVDTTSPRFDVRQRRSPSVDTGTQMCRLMQSEIKESRSLNAEMNCLAASPLLVWPKPVKASSDDTNRIAEVHAVTKLSPAIMKEEIDLSNDLSNDLTPTTRTNLYLDLKDNPIEFSNVPSGLTVPRSIKGKLKLRLGKMPFILRNNGNTLIPPIQSLTSSSESVVLTGYKKLEQSLSLPQNLTTHLTLPRTVVTPTSHSGRRPHRSYSTMSMPNLLSSNDLSSSLQANSESMPDLGRINSPSHSLNPPDILSWPSTSIVLPSPDTTDITDTDPQDQSLEEIPPAPKEFASSVTESSDVPSGISAATSTLPTPAEATSGTNVVFGSSSPTTCNSELPSEQSPEWRSSLSGHSCQTEDIVSPVSSDKRKASDSQNIADVHKTAGKSKRKGGIDKHIYEEIHLPPEEFRDPPGGSSSTTQTGSGDSSQDFSYSISDSVSHKVKGTKLYEIKKLSAVEVDKDGSSTDSATDSGSCTSDNKIHTLDFRQRMREYIPDVIRAIDRESVRTSYLEAQCTLFEMLTDCSERGFDQDAGEVFITDPDTFSVPPPPTTKASDTKGRVYQSPDEFFEWESSTDDKNSPKLVSVIGDHTVSFIKAKEDFKRHLNIPAMLYSEFPTLASSIPYFHVSEDFRMAYSEGLHLIVCVHGLDGNSADLRLVKTYLELGLPGSNLDFLMSERNQGDTFSDFETMTDKLIAEIKSHIEMYSINPSKISFIGHSLGNIIIRSALARPGMKPWISRLHTFLSLSGPHLGTLYNNSGLVNMGMWFMQKWKKSGSLLQLAMKDATNIRQTFLYKLSQKSGLEHFKNVLLFGSSQDRYVPIHSARIELCKAALKDASVQGAAYREMVHNLLQPALNKLDITFIRYDVHHALPNTPNSIIGRAAHIAVLDSELFIEKFLTVCGLKYFR